MSDDRSYNDPKLNSLEFLEAVMRDPNVPLQLRAKAAEYLLPYTEHPQVRLTLHPVKDTDVTITIKLPTLYGDEDTSKMDTKTEVVGHA
jgi:hypothetical protein